MQTFSVNVVGESYRQAAIKRSRKGEAVQFFHDVKNKHDARAIAVFNSSTEQIGFLPRDGWLTRALLDERRSVTGVIADIHAPDGERRFAAVVLQVTLL